MRWLLLSLAIITNLAFADRIKDLTNVAGVRSNQLIGYGLVVGLNGTGDGGDVPFTGQSLRSVLSRLVSTSMVSSQILMLPVFRPQA